MTLQVGSWVAILYQLMAMLDVKLTAGCLDQLMVMPITGCPPPWAPHWVHNLFVVGFTTPFGGGGSCTGPMVWVDRQLWSGSFVVNGKDLFLTLQFDNMTTAELLWRKIYKQGGKRKRMQRGEDSTMYKSKYSAIVIKQ